MWGRTLVQKGNRMHRKQSDMTTGYLESSDEKLNTFFDPDKDAVSPTMLFGVKLDLSPDESDLANGAPFAHHWGSERFNGRN